MLRSLLSLILSATLVCPPLAGAREFRAPNMDDTARFLAQVDKAMRGAGRKAMAMAPNVDRAELLKKIKDGSVGGAKAVAGTVGHNAHTLMLLWILGGVEAIRQQEHLRPITGDQRIREPKNALEHINNWWNLSLNVGHHMVNSLELSASLAGGGTALTAGAPVLNVLNQLTATSTRPYLAKLLTHGTGSFVAFIGFEAGHQIISEAIWILEKEDDIKIAKDLKFTELMMGGGTADQRRVFAQIMANVYDILTFAKPDVLGSWLYNTWRHRIGTGEFVTMLTAMVTAGVAAGTLVPGAGWIVGLLVGGAAGVVGGLAAIYLPPRYKRPITDAIRRGRIRHAQSGLHGNYREVYRLYKALSFNHTESNRNLLMRQMENALKVRQGYRQDAGTVLFEQIYDAYLRMQEAEFILMKVQIAEGLIVVDSETQQALDVQKLKTEYTEQMREAKARFIYYYDELLEQQRQEARVIGPWVYDPNNMSHPLYSRFDKYMRDQESMHQSLRQMYAGLIPEKLKEFGLEALPQNEKDQLGPASLVTLNLFYMRGFDESYLLE